MLVLARKPGEAIQIGDGITVHVVEMRGKQVRLGIEARAEQLVHRSELHGRLSAEDLHMVDLPRHQSKAVPAEKEQDWLEKERIMKERQLNSPRWRRGAQRQGTRVDMRFPMESRTGGSTFANAGYRRLDPVMPNRHGVTIGGRSRIWTG
jgi:carbon storage regulator